MAGSQFRYKQNRLQQLRGFCYAAQTGSISKAAARLYLSQPSVSLQIQALEREFGAQLFERHGPRIHLTADGQALFELALPLVEGVDSLDDVFSARRDSIERGKIDIAAGESTILYILPRYVERFMAAYPGIDLRLHNVTGTQGLELLRTGKADFAVGPMVEQHEDIRYHPIFSYDTVLITAKGHPLTERKRVSLKDIGGYPLILPPKELTTYRIVDRVFSHHNIPYEVKLEAGGYEVIKKYVALGLGISVVSSVCVTDDDPLAAIPMTKYFPQRTYGVVLRRGKILSPQARKFVELLDPAIDPAAGV